MRAGRGAKTGVTAAQRLRGTDTAYGFSAKKDLLAQLLALNLEVGAKIEKGDPVTAPGVPENYTDAKRLVTEDCIKPVSRKTAS